MWSRLKTIKKFTPKLVIDKIIGTPICQLENRLVYYYGKGIVVCYTPRCFKIEGIQRVEYGDSGEYAVRMYYFSDVVSLKTELGLADFYANDIVPLENDIIDGAVFCSSTRGEIEKWMRKNPSGDYQSGGITQRLVNGKMTFKNLFISYGQYEFFFYGKSKRTKLTAFQFVFEE